MRGSALTVAGSPNLRWRDYYGSNAKANAMGFTESDWASVSPPGAVTIGPTGETITIQASNLVYGLVSRDPFAAGELDGYVFVLPLEVTLEWRLRNGPQPRIPSTLYAPYAAPQVNFILTSTDVITGLSPICAAHRIGYYVGNGAIGTARNDTNGLFSVGWDNVFGSGTYATYQNAHSGFSGQPPLLSGFWDRPVTTRLRFEGLGAWAKTWFSSDAEPGAWQDFVTYNAQEIAVVTRGQTLTVEVLTSGDSATTLWFDLLSYAFGDGVMVAPNDQFNRDSASTSWGSGPLGTWENFQTTPSYVRADSGVVIGTDGSTPGTGGAREGFLGSGVIDHRLPNAMGNPSQRVDLGVDLLAFCAGAGIAFVDIFVHCVFDQPAEGVVPWPGSIFASWYLKDAIDGANAVSLDISNAGPGYLGMGLSLDVYPYVLSAPGSAYHRDASPGQALLAYDFWVHLRVGPAVLSALAMFTGGDTSSFSGSFSSSVGLVCPPPNYGGKAARWLVFDSQTIIGSRSVWSIDQVCVMLPQEAGSLGPVATGRKG